MDEKQGFFSRTLGRLACALGFHGAGVFRGLIDIEDINYQTHAITYANLEQCRRCGKVLRRDYQIGK